MKLLVSALLSLALLLVSSMDAAHAAPQEGDMAAMEMPHEDHDASEMSCCDSMSSRTAPCLGDVVAEMLALAPAPLIPRAVSLAPAAAITSTGRAPDTPTGPPKG